MSPAYKTRSRILFSATAAVVLGLQVAPWPLSLPAQENANEPTIVQVEAESSEPLSKREQKKLHKSQRSAPPAETPQQSEPLTTPQLQQLQMQLQQMQQQMQQMQQMQPQQTQPQPMQTQQQQMQQQQLLLQQQQQQLQMQQQWQKQQQMQQQPQQPPQPQPGQSQVPPSDVQQELKKLYEKNGQALPEMVDPKFSQPASKPSAATSPSAQPQNQNQAQTQATPASAPKKKGVFGKFFGGQDDGPIQPPVEPPYTPPTATSRVTPPAIISGQPTGQPILQPTSQGSRLPNYSQLFTPPDGVGTPQNQNSGLSAPPVAAAPANDGFEAPLYVETPAENGANGLPAIDFNTPITEPDTVDLGQAAPLPVAKPAVPADPFSDDALFPGATDPATAAPAAVPNSSVAEASEPAETLPSAEEEAPVDENPYSGLTLDADPFSDPSALRVAPTAPREFPVEKPAFPEETVETTPPALMTPPQEEAPSIAEEQPEQRIAVPNPETNSNEAPLVDNESESRPPTRLVQTPGPGNERTRAKQEMIAARKGLRGLKGFCPVVLRDDRDLVDAHSQFRVIFNSKTYYLSSSEAVSAFHSDPAKYAPAARGCDVIQQAISGEELEGSLDFAVWYKGRLYLFASAETMDTFVSSPSSHATLD